MKSFRLRSSEPKQIAAGNCSGWSVRLLCNTLVLSSGRASPELPILTVRSNVFSKPIGSNFISLWTLRIRRCLTCSRRGSSFITGIVLTAHGAGRHPWNVAVNVWNPLRCKRRWKVNTSSTSNASESVIYNRSVAHGIERMSLIVTFTFDYSAFFRLIMFRRQASPLSTQASCPPCLTTPNH